MADLSAQGRDRGQILLIAALALGVTFVALALILNAAIFSENLATRGGTTGGDEAIEYRDDIRRGIGTVLADENREATDSTTHSDLQNRMQTALGGINEFISRHEVRLGRTVNVSWSGDTDGLRIFQTNEARAFTNDGGIDNWTLASTVDNTRDFELNVSQSGLSETCTHHQSCFNLSISDGVTDWNVSVRNTSGVEVDVEGSGACDPVDEEWVVIDLTAGTVNGTDCGALSFADAPSSGYDIEFNGADQIEGTYSLVIDDTAVASTGDYDSGGGDPSFTDALYDVTVQYEYETADLSIDTTLRVAPGEPND